MSVVNYTIEQLTPTTLVVSWNGLQNGDTGAVLPISQWVTVGYTVTGTQGAGGNIDFQFGTTPSTTEWLSSGIYTDPSVHYDNESTFGAFQPTVTAGDDTTNLNLTVTLMPFTREA